MTTEQIITDYYLLFEKKAHCFVFKLGRQLVLII